MRGASGEVWGEVELASLVASLADAALSGTTRTSAARRMARVLREGLPLTALELGWHLEGRPPESVLARVRAGGEVGVTTQESPLPPELAQGGQEARRVRVAGRPGWGGEVGEGWLLPLASEGRGYALLGLEGGEPPAEALAALGRVLRAAERHLLLLERVARLSRRAYKANQDLRRQLEQVAPGGVVAVSAAMREVLALAAQVAPHDTTVLVRGESGTGKEVIARHIHALSPRRERPFVQVNCGALPHDLVESELFGHEKGAFTSASQRHIGRFERAHGGTILLDEVGELPLHAQVKLLRVLQEGELERVGGEQGIQVDVRVIAATHRDLEAMVQAGLFRADLFYRLNVFPLTILPLRERPEDIPALVEHLVGGIARRLGRAAPHVTPDGLARLGAAPWPGNVRELENVLERALILSPGEVLHLPGLPSVAPPRQATEGGGGALAPLEEHIRAHIAQALRLTQGKLYGADGAAALLGLKPSTLQSRMARLGLSRDDFTPHAS